MTLPQLLAQSALSANVLLRSPLAWIFILGGLGLWLIVPRGRASRWTRAAGGVLAAVAAGLVISQAQLLPNLVEQGIFWMLAAVALISAGAMISVRSPVYSAIWFAMSLLGVAGLFLFQGAQLLGVATVVVYAGAIVVMFLFLLMLAQPEGQAYYDRITWGPAGAILSAVVGAGIVVTLTATLAGVSQTPNVQARQALLNVIPELQDDGSSKPALTEQQIKRVNVTHDAFDRPIVQVVLTADAAELRLIDLYPIEVAIGEQLYGRPLSDGQLQVIRTNDLPLRGPDHVAGLGRELFSRHLLAVELAGTLLMVALVGAVAIVIQGREGRREAGHD